MGQHIMNRREFAILASAVFFTVIAWILFGINHASKTTTISQKELKQVVPLTPTFDNDIINKLKNREE